MTYVPVNIRSPGNNVVPWLKKAIVFATLKIMSPVLESYEVVSLKASEKQGDRDQPEQSFH